MIFRIPIFILYPLWVYYEPIAQLEEHCTGATEVMDLNPFKLEFFQTFISQLPKLWVLNCDDQSCLRIFLCSSNI